MQNLKLMLGTVLCGSLIGLQSCKKENVTPQNPATTNVATAPGSTAARMWISGRTLYGVGLKPQSMTATLYSFTPPFGLTPTGIAGFFVGGTQVTNVSGLAFTTGLMVISTSPASNFPNRLISYNFGSYATPVSMVSCPNITDIEFNEYNGRLYGIFANAQIVEINPGTGATVLNLAPPLGGLQLKGLCNYNGLLSYSIADNTGSPDRFYAYNPGAPAVTPALYATDWGFGDGGMQYCDGFGWVIISFTDTKKLVGGASPYPVTGPAVIPGGPYQFVDLTSN